MRSRRLVWGTLWVVGAILVGPLGWAVIASSIGALRNDPTNDFRTSAELLSVFSRREPLALSQMAFDPHIYDAKVVATDCGMSSDALRGAELDSLVPDKWTPARGWLGVTTGDMRINTDEWRDRQIATIEQYTSRFERIFLTQCIVATAAQPLCRSRVRELVRDPVELDREGKAIYEQEREDQRHSACLFLRGIAANDRAGTSRRVSTR